MTKISIVASGTRGDVQPYVALGKGLQDTGYDVHLFTSDNFEPLVTDAGLTFGSTVISLEERLQSEEWRKALEGGNFLTILSRMQKEMKGASMDIARRLPSLLEGSDLIVAGMSAMGIYSIADMLKIPILQAFLFPFTPTQEFATPLVPKLPFGKALNRLSFHITRQMFWQTSKTGDAAVRQHLGMPKGSFWGPFGLLERRHLPTLYGYSAHVLPRPQDWTDNHHVTGYWFLNEPDGWSPPADLLDFLNAGDPPIYIGFGSMSSRNPHEAGQIALDALARSGQRGVIASGWGGLELSNIPKNVYLMSSMPHSWLFPRMAAVVHHGGAGTTAAGLRAGVPSIIVPFMADQTFWGQRTADLGVGTAPIARKKLTGERLAAAIHEAVTNTSIKRKAAELGQNIRAEEGIANAVAIVDRFMQQQESKRVFV